MSMPSAPVFAVVSRHLTEIVEEVDPSDVGRDVSMKDLGASSLDMVEVVSCSMRELKIKVPRSQLARPMAVALAEVPEVKRYAK